MSVKVKSSVVTAALLTGVAASALSSAALAQVTDTIVVTSQRTEQSLQDVPISVTALGGDDLQDRQIEGFTDIQFNTPNLNFTKSQFTSSVISIRGVSQLAVASTSTDSVSIHQNDIPQSASRLFETEFYDVERIEVLRGPQGTLFGRNATGGVLNVITNKADPDGVSASAEAQYGSFDSVKVNGHLNLPISDTFAVRIAGAVVNRDGYTENIATGNNIDGRDLYSVRGSMRWFAGEDTTVDVAVSYFKEDDNRSSFQKTRCNSHPLLGCATGLVDELGFDQADPNGTIATLASSGTFATLGGLLGGALEDGGAPIGTAASLAGLFGSFAAYPTGLNLNTVQGLSQPTDPRQIALDFDPVYKADELFVSANITHDFEQFSLKLNGGYGDTSVNSIRDTDGGVGPTLALPNFAALPNVAAALMVPMVVPNQPGLAAYFANGLPTSQVGSESGVISGDVVRTTNNLFGIEQSAGATKYWTVEGIVSSNLDGPVNFLGGVNFLKDKSRDGADFNVSFNALDYLTVVGGTLTAQTLATAALLGGGGPSPALDSNNLFSFFSPTFNNNSVNSELRSISAFGEVYWDIDDELKLTLGGRYNNDRVTTLDRNSFLSSFSQFVAGTLANPVVPVGTPDSALQQILDSAPLTPGTAGAVADFEETRLKFDAFTGRAVLQWEPEAGQNYYASYSRGFKPGGVNPASTGDLVFSPTFADESINAYEVGAKLTGIDGTLRANLSAFYYDYSNLQVTNIIGLTSVIDNVDATMWGIEGEFLYQPTDVFRMNLTASFLQTEFGEAFIVDPANPAAGQNVDIYRDLLQGVNCVVNNNGLPSLVGQVLPMQGPSGTDLTITPFVPTCDILGDIVDGVNGTLPMGAPNYELTLSGLPINIDGNELPQAPEYSIAVGAEYDFFIGDGYKFTPRVDYFYQGSFWSGSQFNRPVDKIDAYGHLNLQATFEPEEGNWYLRLFAQNVTNNDAVTGQFTGSQGQGVFVNQFILEPRRYGGAIGFRF